MSNNYQLKRLPSQHHHSLKAWNAADELMIKEMGDQKGSLAIYNDGFGYLTCQLADQAPLVITDLKSQKDAIQLNAKGLDKKINDSQFLGLLDTVSKPIDVGLLKIPKVLDLFEMYLQHIHQSLTTNGTVYCGFMTKHFSKGILKLAEKYFDTISQSKAEKKARVLILTGKKEVKLSENIENFTYNNSDIKQYKGIFSGGKIDAATNYLLQNISVPYLAETVLDLACGNGVIGQWILDHTKAKSVCFLDDSFLAIESAKLNVSSDKAKFEQNFQLNNIKNDSLDWIVSNPPFHFEHTIDISIPLDLFNQAYQKLNKDGTLTLVANANLGYESQLKKIYRSVKVLTSNQQFKVYECRK
ncbi:MAG: class I SAM-dependent methyltransferase [Crocinitomicaceae bacterium]